MRTFRQNFVLEVINQSSGFQFNLCIFSSSKKRWGAWGDVGRWCEATTSLLPWRKLLLCLLQYISAFGESSLEASWHRQDNLFQGYAMVWYAMVSQTFSRLLEWGSGGREKGRWSCWCPKLLCPLHSEEVWFLPFKHWGFTLRFHLEKKIQLLKKYLKTTGLGSRRRQWHPTPVFLPGKSHGQRSLVDCSPWGR